MRGKIVRPEVSLDFHNSADALHPSRHMNQIFPEQFSRHQSRVSIVERGRQSSHGEIMAKQGGQQLPEDMRKQMAEAMKILAGEGAKTWFGTDGKSYVQISAKDWDTAKGYLDQYLEGKTAVKNQKAYQETRKQLPSEATLIGLVDALPYFQKMGDYLSAVLKAMRSHVCRRR